jgi:hypothetical protein
MQVCWYRINILCFIVSLLVGIDLIVATKTLSERPFAISFYLVYSFGTTIIWCLEIGWNVAWKLHQRPEETRSKWLFSKFFIEGLVAVYFLWDSGNLVYEWHVLGEEINADELLDVGINLLAYLWLIVVTRRELLEKDEPKRQQPLILPPTDTLAAEHSSVV